MSDLLIKNLELPKSCSVCPLCEFGIDYKENPYETCRATGKVSVGIRVKGRRDDCPLMELSEHGDLIDRDNLIEYISDTFCKPCKRSKPTVCRACDFGDVMDIIEEETPVVLPKSGS